MRSLAAGLALLTVAGCASVATFTARPTDAAASAADVAAGEALHPFEAPNGQWGYVDAAGDVAIEPRFEAAGGFSEGRAAVRIGGRHGYIDPSGRVVIEPRYAMAEAFSEGRARVGVGDGDGVQYGFVAADGTEVVPPVLPEAYGYSDGLAVVRLRAEELTGFQRLLGTFGMGPTDNVYAALDRDGEVVHRLPYVEVVPFSEGLAAFRPNSVRERWGYVAADGSVAIEPRFDGPAFQFTEGLARVAEGSRLGFIDPTGHFVIEPTYRLAGPFSEGLAAVFDGEAWGYIDDTGAYVVPPRFEQAGAFSEGLAAVREGGRWGYVDPTGAVVIPLQFTAAEAFRGGVAYVHDGRRAGYVDRSGRYVWRYPV